MFETLKKKGFKKSLFWSVIFIFLGAFVAVFWAPDAYYAVSGYAQFEQLLPEEIKPRQLVDVNLQTNFGCYMEEYEYNKTTKVSKTTDLYYVIWTGDEYATEYRYMTIKVPVSYETQMEAMAENTYNQLLSDTINFCGKIKKLDDEEYSYFIEYFEESGWTEDEITEGTLPYYIECYNSKTSMNLLSLLMFLAGVVLFVIGICRIIIGAKGGFLKKLNQDILNAGYTTATVEADYNQAFAFTKNQDVRVGRLMTYYFAGASIRAIPNAKIEWAYVNVVTHRTNGIKTGTTYNVMIHVDGEKSARLISVPKETDAQEILQKMNTMLPWIIIGHSAELQKLYKSDRNQFHALRYNTCEHVAVEPGFEGYSGF